HTALSQLTSLAQLLLSIRSVVRSLSLEAIEVGEQCQRSNVVRIHLQHTIRRVLHLLRVARSLIGGHQLLERLFLYHRVGILCDELLKCCCLLLRILLLHGRHVSVVFRGILNDFLLCLVLSLTSLTLGLCRAGLGLTTTGRLPGRLIVLRCCEHRQRQDRCNNCLLH